VAGGGHKKRYLCAFHDAYVGIREEKKDLKLPTGREWQGTLLPADNGAMLFCSRCSCQSGRKQRQIINM